ncbi:MAG: hypothetical protein RIQ89_739 [Bacteroidota bacterium]|jgi:hypothetical protein
MLNKLRFLSLFLMVLASSSINAQIFINEYSCGNINQYYDNNNKYEDWIEIYNSGSSAVNLGGYHLSDDQVNTLKYTIPATANVPANGFIRFWCSGRNNAVSTHYHTNFKLSQTKNNPEFLVLSDPSGVVIDQVEVFKHQAGHSWGRNVDGFGVWKIFTSPTIRATNTGTVFNVYAEKPTATLTAGYYTGTQTVSLSTLEPNSVIRYTLDGTLPTASSLVYNGPITITNTTVLKAVTFSNDPTVHPSFILFNTYFININHTLPIISIAGTSLNTLANGNQSLKPYGSLEYFDINGVRKAKTYGTFNSHGQDSWANDQRSIDFVSRDECGYNAVIKEQLLPNTTRDEFQRVILRAAGDDNYPSANRSSNAGCAHLRDAYIQNLADEFKLNLDVRRGTKCLIYLNGSYWGVYDIREKPDDHDFTEWYYGQDKYNIQCVLTWGSTWAEYGGNAAITSWNTLRNYIMTSNVSDPAVWQNINDQLDVSSLVDYVIVNSMVVCTDWLNYNTGWWRGMDTSGGHRKWGYILWDNDASFDFYINYTGVPSTLANAPVCQVEGGALSDPENHIDLLNKLRQNASFNQYYISRYIDLMNTMFSCDVMLSRLDSIKNVINPEMAQHATRWFGSYNGWISNYNVLRAFIEDRCVLAAQSLNNCYSLNGPYPVTYNVDPSAAAATMKINSLDITQFPYTGNYYSGIDILLQAVAGLGSGYQFSNYTTANATLANPSNVMLNKANIVAADSISANFVPIGTSLNNSSSLNLGVYPSVTQQLVNVSFKTSANVRPVVHLIDAQGKVLLSLTNGSLQNGSYQTTIDLKAMNLSQGLYFVRLSTPTETATAKIIFTN